MEFTEEITCIDKNGLQSKFKYSKEVAEDDNDNQKVIFRIVPFNQDWSDWFEFTVTLINPTTGKVTGMAHNNDPQYKAMGIPDKMIEEAKNILGVTIISSTNNDNYKLLDVEWRSIAATKVWQRLEKIGKAKYDTSSDIYTFVD